MIDAEDVLRVVVGFDGRESAVNLRRISRTDLLWCGVAYPEEVQHAATGPPGTHWFVQSFVNLSVCRELFRVDERCGVQGEFGITTADTIQRVNRVRRVLDLSVLWNCRHLSTLAAAAGYVDQAHLARDVRQIADLTPTQFVRQHATT